MCGCTPVAKKQLAFPTVQITYEDLLRSMCSRDEAAGPCTAHKEAADKLWAKLERITHD